MERLVQVRVFGDRQRQRLAGGYRWAASQPSWIARAALLAFLVVVGLPLLLLFALAFLAALVVFGGLALLNAAVAKVRGLFGPGEGRSNVRVIRRRDEI